MNPLLIVGLGGFLGSITRYALSGAILHHSASWRFPLGTFVVNVVGCLMIGILSGLIEKHGIFGETGRLFCLTGVLGGFTTFSAFGLETQFLIRRGELGVALGYVLASVIVGLLCVALGEWLFVRG